jgi:hypothetical protein
MRDRNPVGDIVNEHLGFSCSRTPGKAVPPLGTSRARAPDVALA